MKRGGYSLHILALLGSILTSPYVYADNVINFYNRDSARSVFEDVPVATATPEIEYFVDIKKSSPGLEKVSVPKHQSNIASTSNNSASSKSLPETRAEILKLYGDPEKNVALPGREDAPTPFKAMMASLEAGDTELAEKYAQQYVKYLKSVQIKTDTVMALVNKAMAVEGMIVEESPNAEISSEPDFDEEKARQEVRLAVKNSVPQDPFGEVDVYFFFKMDDENSRLMLPEIEAFYSAVSGDSKVRFIALSVDNASREDLKEYADTFDLKFPIRGGVTLAKKLNVTAVPVTLIMTHNSPQKIVVEKGFRRAFYLEEVTRLMKGEGR